MLSKNSFFSSRFSLVQFFQNNRSRCVRCCVESVFLFVFSVLALSQDNPRPRDPPIIIRITPTAAAPQTGIKLEGYRLGANLEKDVMVLFVQGAAEYGVPSSGGGYEAANVKQGLQELGVHVPKDLQPGPCQVIVEVEGNRTAPLTIQVNVSATAPLLTNLRPHFPRAGEIVWIEGTGFSESDEFELTDALGEAHHFGHELGTSDVNTSALSLPKDLPPGEATLRVLERRSGTNQSSNSLSFEIVNGPTPLDIYSDWLMPVAPGQWLDLIVGSAGPLKSAERVEVLFEQKEQVVIVPTKSPHEDGLRLRVPENLAPGNLKMRTRTIVSGEVSQWSDPVDYQLLDKPAAAKIYSLEIRPLRAEAAFKQNGRIVAIASVSDSDYPRVRVPADKLSTGQVEVMTRVWRGGKPSNWLFKNFGFFWPAKFLPDGTMGEVLFMDRVYLGPDTPKTLAVYRGEKLTLQGTFPVASAEDLQVILRCEGRAAIVLHPTDAANPRGASITMPDDLEDGEYDVEVMNLGDRASTMLPIKLRLDKTSPLRKVK
jgi:hypothetical protein